MPNNIKRKYAFISYSHKDEKIAKWLQRKLESYKLPTEIHNEFEESRYLRPVFRDQTDLNTGILSDELLNHLDSSKYLIVICSPNSAKSTWVSYEVHTFIKWGRLEYIIPFIIDGVPFSRDDNECIPISLLEYWQAFPDKELLGVDIRESKREVGFIRVVSRMLELSFDDLWRRHQRDVRRKTASRIALSIIVCTLLYWFAVPVSVQLELKDAHHQLPIPNLWTLQIADVAYQIEAKDTLFVVNRLPGYLRGKEMKINFSGVYYKPLIKSFRVGLGTNTHLSIAVQRDETFAVYAGVIYDEDGIPIEQVLVQVDNRSVLSDSLGYFRIHFPISEQTANKPILLSKENYTDFRREDECPSCSLQYILRKNNNQQITK